MLVKRLRYDELNSERRVTGFILSKVRNYFDVIFRQLNILITPDYYFFKTHRTQPTNILNASLLYQNEKQQKTNIRHVSRHVL